MQCGCEKHEATFKIQVSPITSYPIQWQEMCGQCALEYIGADPVQMYNIKDWEMKERVQRIARTA